MKVQEYDHVKQAHRYLSMFLVMLFLSITGLQLIHAHKQSSISEQSNFKNSIASNEKCEVCDFMLHSQSKFLLQSYPPEIPAPLSSSVAYNGGFCLCNYDFPIQGFTNKGPPSVALQILV